ncbi:hypothetical protein [Bradyrhizobium erythrophlei]|uniref:Uncharacterized protein n=1 Tax=Bradyrhizobium erythrophlei TaxID=1437360 RepID=A0A1M5GXT9_9BRAD|nr:hypothetical protein [Bradyrhizobium erythrophlei]SHG08503.1 hypothetical protein SAMN05443248_0226 [Bradyrhizobium erythrophlei]
MPSHVNTAADLEKYFLGFATKLFHAPGAPTLANWPPRRRPSQRHRWSI